MVLIFLAMLSASCGDKSVKTDFSVEETRQAAVSLVGRVTEGRQKEFKVVVTGVQQDGKDWFSVYS